MASSTQRQIDILHVDDEPDFVEMASTFVERQDDRFTVETATRVEEALERLRTEDFDCLISDYDMPNNDGLDFLREVRSEFSDLPFVLFTGKGSEEVASVAITEGVTDYLQKEGGTDQYAILANRVANVVERRQAINQFSQSQRAMETANEGLSLVEPDGTFSYANPAFANLFGYEPSELIGEHWKILYHNNEAERLENDILPAVAEKGYWSGETVRRTKDGERVVTDHRLANTDSGAIVCTAQDVTRERTEPTATTSGIDLLTDFMDDTAFYTLDHEGYITRWNEGAERLKGFSAREAIGKHMSAFFPDEAREMGLPEQLIERAKTEGSVTDEGWRLRKDGSRFWADVTLSASYDDGGTLRGFGKVIREGSARPTS